MTDGSTDINHAEHMRAKDGSAGHALVFTHCKRDGHAPVFTHCKQSPLQLVAVATTSCTATFSRDL